MAAYTTTFSPSLQRLVLVTDYMMMRGTRSSKFAPAQHCAHDPQPAGIGPSATQAGGEGRSALLLAMLALQNHAKSSSNAGLLDDYCGGYLKAHSSSNAGSGARLMLTHALACGCTLFSLPW